MASTLSKVGITQNNTINSWHVTQSIDALTGVKAYDLTISGSLTLAGATKMIGTASYAETASYISNFTTNQVQFDTSAALTASVGQLTWNDVDGTLDLGLKGGNVRLQIGQEQLARVVNKTPANLLESEYKVVKINGVQGQRLAVGLAQANNDLNSASTLGVVTENITKNQEGFVTTFGLVRGINTTGTLQGETWNGGDVLYLSDTEAGKLTNVKPLSPGHLVTIGYVVYAHAVHGKIFVKVDNGYELEELHDVYLDYATIETGSALIYDGTVWTSSMVVPTSSFTYNANNIRIYNPATVNQLYNITFATPSNTAPAPTTGVEYKPLYVDSGSDGSGMFYNPSINRMYVGSISGSGGTETYLYGTASWADNVSPQSTILAKQFINGAPGLVDRQLKTLVGEVPITLGNSPVINLTPNLAHVTLGVNGFAQISLTGNAPTFAGPPTAPCLYMTGSMGLFTITDVVNAQVNATASFSIQYY